MFGCSPFSLKHNYLTVLKLKKQITKFNLKLSSLATKEGSLFSILLFHHVPLEVVHLGVSATTESDCSACRSLDRVGSQKSIKAVHVFGSVRNWSDYANLIESNSDRRIFF